MTAQERDVTEDGSTTWGAELVGMLNLAKENTTAAMAFVFFLTGCSIFFYASEERAAISILSSETIAAIPLLFCLIVLFTILMLSFVITPTWLALDGASASRNGRLQPLFLIPAYPKNRQVKVRNISAFSLTLWLTLFSSPGLLLCSWAYVEVRLEGHYDTGPWLLLIVFVASVLLMAWMVGHIRRPNRHRTKLPDLMVRVVASIGQAMVMITLISAIASYSPRWNFTDELIVAILAASCIFAAMLQTLVIAVISRISERKGLLRRATLCTLLVVVIFCIYPPISSIVLRPFFGASAAPSSQCFRFAVNQEADLPLALKQSQFVSHDGQKWSPRLRAIAPINDSIQVRLKQDNGITYRIDSSLLEQTLACSDEKKQSKKTVDSP